MPQIQVIEPLARPQVQKIRVAAYCRVSSDSDDQRNSFSTQVQHYTQLIQSHPDWEFVDIYADEGIAGTRADKRDDFQRLMADCRTGKIDRVLVKSLSRFARNSKDCIQAVRELQSLGISVFFEKEHLDTGKLHNEMTLSMMSAFAQEESISISQNMRRGALMRMKNGTFRISQVPYGYRRKESGELIPTPEEAEAVRWIYHSFLSGKGIASIAKDLESRKVPKLRGEPVWSKHGVLYILTNERYAGNELFRKSYRTDAIPFRKVDNRGEKSQFYAEATHEAIVPFQTFQLVQKLLQKSGKNSLENSSRELSIPCQGKSPAACAAEHTTAGSPPREPDGCAKTIWLPDALPKGWVKKRSFPQSSGFSTGWETTETPFSPLTWSSWKPSGKGSGFSPPVYCSYNNP